MFIPDVQGSVIATLDSAGTLTKRGYFPYGESASTTGTFGYTGLRIDPETSGFYYARARMYSPAIGRFLQPDPIGQTGGRNLYSYVGNDPLNAIDPSGQVGIFGALWGGAAGGVSGAITGFVQDGWRGAAIGIVTGGVTGASVGFFLPSTSAAAGSRVAAAAVALAGSSGAYVGNLGQQALNNQVYKIVDPSQISPISQAQAAGAAAAGPIGGVVAKGINAFGKGILQATAGIFGATPSGAATPATTSRATAKIVDSIYEGSRGALGELVGGSLSPSSSSIPTKT